MSVRQVNDGGVMPEEVPKNVPYGSLAVSPMSSLKRARLALARAGNGRPCSAGRPAFCCLPRLL